MKFRFGDKTLFIFLFAAWVVLGLPYLLGLWSSFNGEPYTPFSWTAGMIVMDETASYAPQVAEVLDGRIFSNNHLFQEGKDRPLMPASLFCSTLVAILGKITGNVHHAWILSHLIFPFFSMYLLGLCLSYMTGDRRTGFLSAIFIFLANDFLTLGYIKSALTGTLGLQGPLFFTRHYSPSLTLIPFLAAIACTVCSLLKDHDRMWTCLAGIFSGLLFYTYFFYWTLWFPTLGILYLFLFVNKEKEKALRVALITVLGSVVALPWVYKYFQARQMDYFSSYSQRLGFGIDQPFSLHHTLLLGVLGLASFYLKGPRRWLTFSLAGAGLFVLNYDWVLGLPSIQKEHWHSNFLKTFELATIITLVASVALNHGFQKLMQAGLKCCALVAIFAAGNLQWSFAKNHESALRLDSSTQDILTFFKKQTLEQDVVFVEEEELRDRVLLYSRRPTFLHSSDFQPVSNLELIERAAYIAKILHLEPKEAEKLLYFSFAPGSVWKNSRAKLRELVENPTSGDELRKKFKLDYLVLSSAGLLSRMTPHLDPVLKTSRFSVFRLPSAVP